MNCSAAWDHPGQAHDRRPVTHFAVRHRYVAFDRDRPLTHAEMIGDWFPDAVAVETLSEWRTARRAPGLCLAPFAGIAPSCRQYRPQAPV